jgi:hypothetical protein
MLNLHVMTNSLIVICNDTHVISAEDPRYSQILKLLGEGKVDELKIKNILTYIEEKPTEQDLRIEVKPEENKILIDGIEMPEGLKKRFLELKRRHKPRAYLLKFWDKLQKNPNQNSIQMLYKFLEHNGHPIMADGDFIAYKAVTMDLLDHYTRTNKHKVGKVVKMDRKDVDADPAQTCSHGLHICSSAYLKEFNPNNSRYLEVLVDPKDVVAVPDDYDGTKCRVSRYKVYREVTRDDIDKRK